jgi:single-strand DNA-binding protein|tara:strand:+ start:856 stop:1260 length:405 start_codon:yes stop_codon:yes gene_type:complete
MAFDNTVTVSGNVVRDPELRFTNNNKAVCEFTVAWNQMARDGQEKKAHFFDCVAWEKMAESVSENARRGQRVTVTGRLNFESWEKDGQKRNKVNLVVEDVGMSLKFKDSGVPDAVASTAAAVKTVQAAFDEEPF